MARRTPKVKDGYLENPEAPLAAPIKTGSAEWFAWLEKNNAFIFERGAASYTAHKQQRQGSYYWYAYRRKGGRLNTVYLGKTAELEEKRLEEVARELAGLDGAEAQPPPEELEIASLEVPLVATKLNMPQYRPGLVRRTRLLEMLIAAHPAGVPRKLTLVSAPPGFGKTTLLVEWLNSTGLPVAWFSLDDGDNDPVRFMAYLIAALEELKPGIGANALALLHSSRARPVEDALAALVNALSRQSGTHFLVLDDYHFIESNQVHSALTFLLDHLPPQLQLVIASRADPPLPLSRLRARGELVELRATDLRFLPEEVESFLNRVMQLNLPPEQVQKLFSHTEGWVAGLQLAALSLKGRDREQARSFINTFTGNQRFILDYLADEVLRRQSPELQAFLLETSILERLSGPLCDAVTGGEEGQQTLEKLERANLFIIPLDDERQWFRYHQLFAEFLQSRLAQSGKARFKELHRRAAGWYAGDGLLEEAIEHALKGEDFELAGGFIEQLARGELMRGEVGILGDWFDQLPETMLDSRPRLGLYQAWTYSITGHLGQAEKRLAFIEQSYPEQFSDEITAIRSLVAMHRADLSGIGQIMDLLKSTMAEGNPFLQSFKALAQGFAYDLAGNASEATRAYNEANLLSRAQGNLLVQMIATSQEGDLQQLQGQLHKAAETYRKAMVMLRQGSSTQERTPIFIESLAQVGLAQVLYEWNELEEAGRLLEECSSVGEVSGHPLVISLAYLLQGRVKQAQGDMEEAGELVAKSIEVVQKLKLDWMAFYLTTYRVRLWLAEGRIEEAERWLREIPEKLNFEGTDLMHTSLFTELVELSQVRVLLALGRADEALSQATRLIGEAEADGRFSRVIDALNLRALAFLALGDLPAALQSLEESFELAEPQNYMRLFLDEGEPEARLLESYLASRAPRHALYAERLLNLLTTPGVESLPPAEVTSPDHRVINPDSLSERELEVLRLMAIGLSNQQIAIKLVVEVSTVKTHLLHLFTKLQARTRTEAVARARELHLL